MKLAILVVSVFLLFSVQIQAQNTVKKLKEFTASNGITYKIGDKIQLGRGSGTNGKFVYVSVGGMGMSSNPDKNRLGSANTGLLVTVKKIKKYDYKRYKGVYFTVGGGNITNYNLDIENAIATCEIKDCKNENDSTQSVPDKYDRIKKAKKLFDEGILTKEEYEAEKKKILSEE